MGHTQTEQDRQVNHGFYLHYGWTFKRTDVFPLKAALDAYQDKEGYFFFERDYQEEGWEKVTLPHTFNDVDLFRDRIQDAGSGQARTMAFYRKWFTIPKEHKNDKVFIAFEGVRQTCYLYVNGKLAGYCENGVAPFGFDLTEYVDREGNNLLAIATDNTTTRNIPFCIAETPNKPEVAPGSYLLSQMEKVDPKQEGVGFFWNCNDFNPSVGGITRPVKLYYKPKVYLTLPLYSNLRTKGCYLYAENFCFSEESKTHGGSAKICVEAEIRNETEQEKTVWLEVEVRNIFKESVFAFSGEPQVVPGHGKQTSPLSITPEDAYEKTEDGHYIPRKEEEVKPTCLCSEAVTVVTAQSGQNPLRFWSIDDPYLYRVVITMHTGDGIVDEEEIETGFCKIGYDKNRGVLINEKPVWLRGYAQRATNEWAAIGIAPEWLKDMDMRLLRESNANHIRWMHVAAPMSDIRACDRQGVVCTQPAGDKERENFGRQWDQRVELMRDVIIAFRNQPSILFWEAGNNSIGKEHMKEMRMLREVLDPKRGRFMGCRTINTEEVLVESEYVGTMLNRHAARFIAEHGPIMETEYSREEAPRRVWDDYTPPHYDYDNLWIGMGGRKQPGTDFHDLTSEDLARATARGYSEFFNDRIGGASGHDWYSACAALCWTDSAQHGRQSFSENGRMSGRVDPVRNKKQNFDVFRVMQSREPAVKILGHWNYPKEDGTAYRYAEKVFDGEKWVKSGSFAYRNPHEKTIYVIGSDAIARVVLEVNGKAVGECAKPVDTFVFAIEGVDITNQGVICAYAYDYAGNMVAQDRIETAGEPARIEATLHTSPAGFAADGADVAYVDVRVLDERGRLCPLCDSRIDFETTGEAEFLGGYNSGRFEGFGKDDSVIHENYVYAECGYNRVFLRSTFVAGEIQLKISMEGMEPVLLNWESKEVQMEDGCLTRLTADYMKYTCQIPESLQDCPSIKEADACKYVPEDQLYCKILWNGQEPDSRGVRSVNKNGSIWGAVLCILDRIKGEYPESFSYIYDAENKRLEIQSAGHHVIAEAGRTHLLVDGQESLMDGEPYISESGQFVMEINAVISYIDGVIAYYDDKVNVFRVETKVK